jgi:hypothetical protein
MRFDRSRKIQVRVAGPIGSLHGSIARQGRGNTEFLLRPIDIGERVIWRRPYEATNPS